MSLHETIVSRRRVVEGKFGKSATRTFYTDTWAEWETAAPAYGDEHPDDPNLRVVEREAVGLGEKMESDGSFAQAIVTVTYSTEDTLRTDEWFEFASSVIPFGTGITWKSDGTTNYSEFPILQVHGIYVLEKVLDSRPINDIIRLTNRTNINAYKYFGPYHLLYEGARMTEEFPGGVARYRVQHRMRYRDPDWRYLLRPDTGQWDRPSNRAQEPYEAVAFNL